MDPATSAVEPHCSTADMWTAAHTWNTPVIETGEPLWWRQKSRQTTMILRSCTRRIITIKTGEWTESTWTSSQVEWQNIKCQQFFPTLISVSDLQSLLTERRRGQLSYSLYKLYDKIDAKLRQVTKRKNYIRGEGEVWIVLGSGVDNDQFYLEQRFNRVSG